MSQNFDLINWELEAERVRRAFEIPWECEFVKLVQGSMGLVVKGLPRIGKQDWGKVVLGEIDVRVRYCENRRNFFIGTKYWGYTHVDIAWDGALLDKPDFFPSAVELATFLYRLELLTLEIEEALVGHLSYHERLEMKFDWDY